jgi:hypothetical protein
MRNAKPLLLLLVAGIAGGCREDLPTKLGPGQAVSLSGEIAAGVECPMLVAAAGRRFSLAGDLGRFKPGDRVCVKGKVAEMSFCMAGEATIAVEAIGPEDSCP